MIADEDGVAVEYIGRGTNTGPLVGPSGPLPPTGRGLEMRLCDVYKIENDKVVAGARYYDWATLARQLGLSFPGA